MLSRGPVSLLFRLLFRFCEDGVLPSSLCSVPYPVRHGRKMFSSPDHIDDDGNDRRCGDYQIHLLIPCRIDQDARQTSADPDSDIIGTQDSGIGRSPSLGRSDTDSHCLKRWFQTAEGISGKGSRQKKCHVIRHQRQQNQSRKHKTVAGIDEDFLSSAVRRFAHQHTSQKTASPPLP